ncbi:hypothetical protein ACTS9C_02430 [Empedobacter brevis]
MNNENLRKITELLNPEVFKSNLILASLYIAYFENTIDYIIDQPRTFFSDTYTSKKGFIPNSDYKQKVLNLAPKNPLKASLIWFKDLNGISGIDIEDFGILRKYRNKLAHELSKILLDEGLEIEEFTKNLSKLFELRIKIEKYWFFNFELDSMEIENAENLTETDVSTGGEMMYKLFMDLLSEDNETANYYSQEFKKYLDNENKK